MTSHTHTHTHTHTRFIPQSTYAHPHTRDKTAQHSNVPLPARLLGKWLLLLGAVSNLLLIQPHRLSNTKNNRRHENKISHQTLKQSHQNSEKRFNALQKTSTKISTCAKSSPVHFFSFLFSFCIIIIFYKRNEKWDRKSRVVCRRKDSVGKSLWRTIEVGCVISVHYLILSDPPKKWKNVLREGVKRQEK